MLECEEEEDLRSFCVTYQKTEDLLEEFCGRRAGSDWPEESKEQKTNRIMEAFDSYFVEKQTTSAPYVSDPVAEAEWDDVRRVRTIAEEEEEDEEGTDEEEAAAAARARRLRL